jgi:hypothetical protein
MSISSRDSQGCTLLLLFVIAVAVITTLPGFLVCYFALDIELPIALLIGFLVGNCVIGILEIIPFPFKLLRHFRSKFLRQPK